MLQISIQYFKTPFGELILGDFEGGLVLCDWRYRKSRKKIDRRVTSGLSAEYVERNTGLLKKAKAQVQQYLNGSRQSFELPFRLVGTDFQRKVWTEMQNIPYGETITYLQLSRNIGDENAIRAVSTANGANAINLIVPCHRVIGSDGSLIGYAGGTATKEKLLQLEGALQEPNQLSLFEKEATTESE